jgi:murein L,D-transpeptidase YcbB/YkuD
MLAIIGSCAAGSTSCAGNRAGIATQLGQVLAAGQGRTALAQRMCGARPDSGCAKRATDVWTDLHNFYQDRAGEPVWVNGRQPASAATIALASIGRAAGHGLDPEKYGASSLKAEAARLAGARGRRGATPDELAKFETDLTAALLALGRDVAVGRPGQPPAGVGDRRRKSPDIAVHLASLIDENDLTAWPDDVRPVHPQYAALQQALAKEPLGSPNRARLALNLERWRWIPDDLGDRYVLVNIPSYHMWVFENVRPVLDSKVIVGKLGDETPVFSATMTNVVFSPYWNIPESIAEGETVPSVIRNPEYLQKNNIEVLRRSRGAVERVDPATVDWNNASATSDISLRQRPGPGNALGHIKFLLPNKNNVYLHDTPTHNLFDRRGRAFSHGCVRVEEPVELAKYVLGDEPKWTEAAIRKAMDSGEEQGVKLNRTLPVHIVYFTAWAEPDGTVAFLSDVYGRDR